MFMGASHSALKEFNARVSARLYVVAHKPLRLLYGADGYRSTFPVGKSIVAYPPRGSIQTERVRLPYDVPSVTPGILFKERV